MAPFYRALNKRNELGRPVRIAYFGDSFIEVDILTAPLREDCSVSLADTVWDTLTLRPLMLRTVRRCGSVMADGRLIACWTKDVTNAIC